MADLPLDSWILVLASVGLGLALEAAYLRARRAERRRDREPRADADGAP